jgi:hypothetical protein
MKSVPLAAALLCLARPAAAINLIADYQLNDTFASAVAGAPPLVPLSSVSFTSANVYGQNRIVASFLQGSGLRLSAPAGISTGGYTVAIVCAISTTTGFRKLIDFHDLTLDTGLYNFNNVLYFYPVIGGASNTIAANAFMQVVLTRDATGHVAGYVNGVPQLSFQDTSNFSVLSGTAFNLFVDDTATGGTEASAGMVARVRLYTGALTAAEVAALDGNPPPPCGSADFNHDGDSGTDADIEAFFACLAGNCCATCDSADFNGDGDSGTDADIEAFFRVLAGGTC